VRGPLRPASHIGSSLCLRGSAGTPQGGEREGCSAPVAARTVEVDLPAQTTLDQAIVALLKLRRGDVPGDATLERALPS
jgi:hypothetical protein